MRTADASAEWVLAEPRTDEPVRRRWLPCATAALLSAILIGLAVYGKLTSRQGGEYFNIARALYNGHGYSNPFGRMDGPTAWMAPVFPWLLAALHWAAEGDRDTVTWCLVVLHMAALIATAVFVLALAWQTARRLWPATAAVLFLLATLYHFNFWFSFLDDCWLMLLCLDLLIAGICWWHPLASKSTAAAWGIFGGLLALTNPIIGFTWGGLSLGLGVRQRAWSKLVVTTMCVALTVAPWMIRNYLVFGRLIPVKSNLAFELYQSHVLQPDGLLQTLRFHPGGGVNEDGWEYRQVKETAFLDHKWQKFRDAVWNDPEEFLDRVTLRFLGATLWYVPFNRAAEANPEWLLWTRRCAHPLPFLALVFLLFTHLFRPLSLPQWTVIGAYGLYLLPYIASSYYERYAAPLLAIKVLLVFWAIDQALCLSRRSHGEEEPIAVEVAECDSADVAP